MLSLRRTLVLGSGRLPRRTFGRTFSQLNFPPPLKIALLFPNISQNKNIVLYICWIMCHTLTPCGQMNSVTWALTLYLNPAAVLDWSRTESDNNPYINNFEFWVKWIWDRVQQWCPGMFVQIGQCWQSHKVPLMWQILPHSIQHHRHHQTIIGRSGALLSLPDRFSQINQFSQMLKKDRP